MFIFVRWLYCIYIYIYICENVISDVSIVRFFLVDVWCLLFQQDAMLKARNDLQLAVTEAWPFNKEVLWQSL